MWKKGNLYSGLCIVILFCTSCSLELDPNRKLRDKEDLIEQLLQQKIDSIDVVLDSICVDNKTQNFERLKDSVLQVRLNKLKENSASYYETRGAEQ